MKLSKKALMAMALSGGVFLVGCGGNDTPEPVSQAVTPQEQASGPAQTEEAPVEENRRDLGGLEIVVANWWQDYRTDTFNPATAHDEAVLNHRLAMEERYNFRVVERMVAGWDEYFEMVNTSIVAGDPVGHVVILNPAGFTPLMRQGMLSPLVGPSIDFNDRSLVPWNNTIIDATSVNGVPYAFQPAYLMGPGIYWNMRLFEEAGLDPELPFDLLLAGEWTWDAFVEILRANSRDTTNDGVIDIHAMASLGAWTLPGFVSSNMATFVGREPDGTFYNGTTSPEFFEALHFVQTLYNEGLIMSQPEGSAWNFFEEEFTNGRVAMTTGFMWHSQPHFGHMTDTIGFVPFPMGPAANQINMMAYDTFMTIPYQYSDIADDIMFAMTHWLTAPEGFNDPDAWISEFLPLFAHPRSVEEAMALFIRNQDYIQLAYHLFVPGYSYNEFFVWHMWGSGLDASTIIEQAQHQIEAVIAEVNN